MKFISISRAILCLFTVNIVFSVEPIWAMSCADVLNQPQLAYDSERASAEYSLEDSYEGLAKSGHLLKQNADYLGRHICGGTCASVALTNTLLSIAEAFEPGSISGLNDEEIQRLHIKYLEAIITEIRGVLNQDGTQGIGYNKLRAALPEIVKSIMPEHATKISFMYKVSPVHALAKVSAGNTLSLLGVITEEGSHAVVAVGAQTREEFAKSGIATESRIIVKTSDPHQPADIVFQETYLSDINTPGDDSKIYFENMREAAESDMNGNLMVGTVQDNITISIGNFAPTRDWTRKEVMGLFKEEQRIAKANIFFRNGMSMEGINLFRPRFGGSMAFVEFSHPAFGEITERIYLKQVAHIEVVDDK